MKKLIPILLYVLTCNFLYAQENKSPLTVIQPPWTLPVSYLRIGAGATEATVAPIKIFTNTTDTVQIDSIRFANNQVLIENLNNNYTIKPDDTLRLQVLYKASRYFKPTNDTIFIYTLTNGALQCLTIPCRLWFAMDIDDRILSPKADRKERFKTITMKLIEDKPLYFYTAPHWLGIVHLIDDNDIILMRLPRAGGAFTIDFSLYGKGKYYLTGNHKESEEYFKYTIIVE